MNDEAQDRRELRPLTERILGWLPGPRLPWIAAWALVPWMNAGANLLLDTGERSAVWEQSRVVVIISYCAVSFAIIVTLVGAEQLARRVATLGAKTSNVLAIDPRKDFREINAVAGPLLAATATALAFGMSALVRDGWTAALLRGATWVSLGIAF